MFRKISTSIIILILSSSVAIARTSYKGEHNYKGEKPTIVEQEVVTTEIPPQPCLTYTFSSGPYLGFSAGIRTNYNTVPSVYKGIEGTLSAGYAMLNSNFYFAAEVFAQDGAELQNYVNNQDIDKDMDSDSVRTNWGFGLSVIPGYIIADTVMGYLRVGVVRTHFVSVSETATGGQVGLGLQTAISDHWDLRGEYVYTFYQSVEELGVPRSDQYNLGLIYKFDT